MITKDEYELRMSELASTINGRLATVISKQAQSVVGNVYQATQFKLQPPVPVNHDRRLAGTKSEVEKVINYPAVVIEVVPQVRLADAFRGEKVTTYKVQTIARLYKSKTDSTEITSGTLFVDGSSPFTDYTYLRKYLSQTLAGPVQDTFKAYLDKANSGLDTKIERAVVYIVDNIQIQQDDTILSTNTTDKPKPKPSTVPPTVPTTPSVPSVPNGTTPEVPTGTTPDTTPNPPASSGNDFLDIESVNQLLTRDESPSPFFTPRFREDTGELLTRDSDGTITTEERDAENVKKTSVDFENVDEPISTVELEQQQQRQYEHQLAVTEAQRMAEYSDALLKETPKVKSAVTPAGTNASVQAEGGREATEEAAAKKDKPKEKPPTKPKAKYFRDWAKKEGADPNGIIYRGTKEKDYGKGTTPKNTYGLVYRYKNLFDWGRDLGRIFSGYSITSPVDVALLLNSGAIGRFNKNIPYMFEEGSETHLAITHASNVIREDEGGVGDFNANARDYLDANWAANPHWCGICTDFMLYTNGKYKADSALVPITATGTITTLYNQSPVNNIPSTLSKKERASLESRLDILKSDTTGANTAEISKIETKLNSTTVIINDQNSCALLKKGLHWSDAGMMPAGSEILKKIAYWPGAFIVRRTKGKKSGHVETLLHITKSGVLYTIGGNTGLNDSNGNGSEYGFKKYGSISEFCGKGYDEFYIYKRGTLAPYTTGIGDSVKKTETYNKYVQELDSDAELNPAAYNILREIMEV